MKTTLIISYAQLFTAGARVESNLSAANAVDVTLSKDGRLFGFEGTLVYDTYSTSALNEKLIEFTSENADVLLAVQSDLQRFNVAYEVSVNQWGTLRVKVLDLLDTHWRLFQLIDKPELKIDAPDGTEHILQFNNDGETSYAEYKFSGEKAEEYAKLIVSLQSMHTPYEIV